jgi:acyl-CoA thioesterase-1
MAHKWLSAVLIVVLLLVALVSWQILYITHHYTASVPPPNIPRGTQTLGSSGTKLRFVVMGDSTSIGQGANYEQGIAWGSAEYLAKNHIVELTNAGVSGARVADVQAKQLAQAVSVKPDVVLLAIGANDVTHLTALSTVRTSIVAIITQLQAANPNVRIILTGSPAMGSVARFAPPTQWLAAARVRQVNAVFADVAQQKHAVLLPLAQKTAHAFKHDPSLYAADNFHPNARGYALWQPVINAGLASVR